MAWKLPILGVGRGGDCGIVCLSHTQTSQNGWASGVPRHQTSGKLENGLVSGMSEASLSGLGRDREWLLVFLTYSRGE